MAPGAGLIAGAAVDVPRLPAAQAVRKAVPASSSRRVMMRSLCGIRHAVGLGSAEDSYHLGPFTGDAQQLPTALPHVGAPPDEFLPFLRGRPEYPQVRDLLPLCGVGFRRWGHRAVAGRAISRVLFARQSGQRVISLGWLSPATSRGLPAAQTTRAGSRCLFGLAPTGGYRATPVARRAVGSYPTVSPLPLNKGRSVFCGPFRRLTAPRRYLAVCPMELGLSSARHSDRRTATITPYRHPEWRAEESPSSDRKSTRLNSSHVRISYAVFCLKKKKVD